MFCAKCGSQVEDGVAFCPSCGNPMPRRPPQQPQPNQQAVPQQQVPAPQQAPYQPTQQQAYPQQPQPQPYQQVPQPQPKKKRRWPVVVAIAVVAAAAIAAVVVFVVLPRVMPKGIWVATKSVGITKDANGTLSYTSTSTLDDRGNVTAQSSETVYNDGSRTTDESSFTYDDQGFAKSESYKYTYEPKASNESSDKYESSVVIQWTYGDGNKPTQAVRTITDANETGTYTKVYEYGKDGKITRTVGTYKGKDSQSETIIEFDDRGLVTKQSQKDDESEETVYQYEFDASNRPVGYTSVTTDTSTNKKTQEASATLKYDENGNMSTESIECTTYPSDGSGPTKSTTTNTYEYEYIENPTPWVAELVRLTLYSFSGTD